MNQPQDRTTGPLSEAEREELARGDRGMTRHLLQQAIGQIPDTLADRYMRAAALYLQVAAAEHPEGQVV